VWSCGSRHHGGGVSIRSEREDRGRRRIVKISIIGAGSTYTPELIEGVGEGRLGTPLDELVLMDLDPARLEILGGLAKRMLDKAGWSGRLKLTTSRDEALDGPDACLVQYRIGGSAARVKDESIPLPHGVLGQETVGPGGWAKALRTVPPTIEIAEALAKSSPKAWLLDFANPVSMVSQALIGAGHRAVGLCNSAIGLQRSAAEHFGVAPERVEIESAGLNHGAWYREIRVDGQPKLAGLIATESVKLAEMTDWSEAQLRQERAIPSYYLRYYAEPEQVVAEQRAAGTRGLEVAKIEAQLLEMYKDPALAEKPKLLETRGGAFYSAAALDLIAALTGAKPARLVVNVRNNGAIPDLPSDQVIEVLSDVDAAGARPIPIAPLGGARHDLIMQLSAFGKATVAAALSGDRRAAIDALALNPLIPNRDVAETIGGELLAAHAAHLPRFAR
jgi:6-phospho-beta-glucosidase